MFHAALSRQRLLFMVTTEAEAIEALARDRPGILLITPKLDQGDGLHLVERTHSIVDDIRTIVLCEQELIDLWVEGLGDRQAAERVGVSYATARSYGRSVRRALGAAGRAKVLLEVLSLGLARAVGRRRRSVADCGDPKGAGAVLASRSPWLGGECVERAEHKASPSRQIGLP